MKMIKTFQKTKFRFKLWNMSEWSATDLIIDTIKFSWKRNSITQTHRFVTSLHYTQKNSSGCQLCTVGLPKTERHLIIAYTETVSFPGVPRLVREDDLSPLVSVEVKNGGSFTSTPHLCLHVMDRDNCTLSTTHSYLYWDTYFKARYVLPLRFAHW